MKQYLDNLENLFDEWYNNYYLLFALGFGIILIVYILYKMVVGG